MSHITEKLAEFVFEELSGPEMAEARRHLAECVSCNEQVDRFQQTLAMLKAAPDAELPRSTVFEFEKSPLSRMWRWLPASVAVAAILLVAIALAGRVHIQWHDAQLTIAFGQVTPEANGNQAIVDEIQRLQGHLAYLEDRQQRIESDTFATASTIQLLARGHRLPTGD